MNNLKNRFKLWVVQEILTVWKILFLFIFWQKGGKCPSYVEFCQQCFRSYFNLWCNSFNSVQLSVPSLTKLTQKCCSTMNEKLNILFRKLFLLFFNATSSRPMSCLMVLLSGSVRDQTNSFWLNFLDTYLSSLKKLLV